MAGPGRSSFNKRQKERARQEKQREKLQRKQQRKLEKQAGVPEAGTESAVESLDQEAPSTSSGEADPFARMDHEV
jgi:hypothetical protein